MTPVYKLSANSVKNGRTVYGSMLAGNTAFVPTDFESIATVTLSSNQSTIDFSSISSSYSHLQLRCFVRMNRAATGDDMTVRFNSDTANNYSWHGLRGDGSGVGVYDSSSTSFMNVFDLVGDSAASNTFSCAIIDILDYKDTNKYKTIRGLSGGDRNGAGAVAISSGNWRSTSAITGISLGGRYGSGILSGSTVALYGIKAAS